MDPSALTSNLPPVVAIVISLATFVFTQIRSQRIDDRAAAKDTVEILIMQNNTLMGEVVDLRKRTARMEKQHNDCERERTALLQRLADLQQRSSGEEKGGI